MVTNSRPRDFGDDLAASQAWAEAPWWAEVYRKAFPSVAAMVNTHGAGWGQNGGIDRVLTLNSGKTLLVDEKVRQKDYGDIALEFAHLYDSGQRKDGWINKDQACDFIAYAFIPSQRCYLLPFHTLRRAWAVMGRYWHQQATTRTAGFYIAKSPNSYRGSRWWSHSVCVPIPVLMSAMSDAMLVRWTGQPVEPLDAQAVLL